MKPLPHALFDATTDDLTPPAGCGVLVRAGADRDSRNNSRFVVVDTDARVETLRHAIARGAAGFALTGWREGADIQHLAALLSVAEAEEDLTDGDTPILAITDGILPTPVSPQGFLGKSARLTAVVWDHRVLMQTLGAKRALNAAGDWTAPFAAARSATLLTAAAAGIPAYDSFSGLTGEVFEAACEQSRDDGFFGGLSNDPEQIPIIQTVYAA